MQDKTFVFYSDKLSYKAVDTPKGKEYYLKGYITTGDLDLVNDIVTKDCMGSMFSQFDTRSIKLDFNHETLRGKSKEEAEINKTTMPLGKFVGKDRDAKGIEITWKLNPTWRKFDEKGNIVMDFKDVWQNCEEGFYDAFSIAYVPTQSRVMEREGKSVRLLDNMNLLNVALTGNPINPGASMTAVMAKSLEYLNEQMQEQKGKWVTMNGRHVYIGEDGKPSNAGFLANDSDGTNTVGSIVDSAGNSHDYKPSKEDPLKEQPSRRMTNEEYNNFIGAPKKETRMSNEEYNNKIKEDSQIQHLEYDDLNPKEQKLYDEIRNKPNSAEHTEIVRTVKKKLGTLKSFESNFKSQSPVEQIVGLEVKDTIKIQATGTSVTSQTEDDEESEKMKEEKKSAEVAPVVAQDSPVIAQQKSEPQQATQVVDTEAKSAVISLKSEIAELRATVEKQAKSLEAIDAILNKPQQKSIGAENNAEKVTANVKSFTGPLDLI